MLNSVSLFAGGGGSALGFEQAGIRNVCLTDNDRVATWTLHTNRPKWNVVCADIRNINFSPVSGADIVEGGFPCQPFSYAGKGRGFADVSGTLFREFARCVDEIKPSMIVAENVKGLVNHDEGRTLKTICETLEKIGYRIEWRVLKARYLGVPQKRERIVIMGLRSDLDSEMLWPQYDESGPVLRDAIYDIKDEGFGGMTYNNRKREVMELVPAGGWWKDLPDGIREEYAGAVATRKGGGSTGLARRLSWDEPSHTLTTSPSQKMTEKCHPEHTRPLTVHEYARVQTFPDDWIFCGSIPQRYRQIGNAVPPEMFRRLGLAIKETLGEG